MKSIWLNFWRGVVGCLLMLTAVGESDRTAAMGFQRLNESSHWNLVWADDGRGDWRTHWLLDGELAQVENSPEGMRFSAGPVKGDDANHAVLWTRESFAGDLKVVCTSTRTDTAQRNVNILYLQATGGVPEPFVEDIESWGDLRRVPLMRRYFNHMDALHISFAAFNNSGPISDSDYVRARRYPVSSEVSWNQTVVPPSFEDTGLFGTGKNYRITAIKTDANLYFQGEGEGLKRLFWWDLSERSPLAFDRVGLRHLFTRSAIYRDVQIFSSMP
jgi:hypothetical protein